MNYHTPLEQFLYDTGIAMPGDVGRIALKIEHSAWLAAHDAEVRAGVVAEEPEWEYGIRDEGANEPFTDHYDSIDSMSEEFDGFLAQKGEEIVRRRKAGPWVEVTDA